MASITFYNTATKDILDGTIDLDTDTIKVSLHSSTYTPSVAHDFYDDIIKKRTSVPGIIDAYENLKIINNIYKSKSW